MIPLSVTEALALYFDLYFGMQMSLRKASGAE
jgi:hypothetical protein